jgi:sugar/nucleoside kinase (ribokinase family)
MTADKSIKALEATGAGDSFGSGFISGLLKKDDVEYALDLGITNSESVIRKIGAQEGILYKKDLDNELKRVNHTLKRI